MVSLHGALPWTECDPAPRPRSMLALAIEEAVRQQVEHVVLFADRLRDEAFSPSAAARLLREHGTRLSLIRSGDVALGAPSVIRSGDDALVQLVRATGGVALAGERGETVVPQLAGALARR